MDIKPNKRALHPLETKADLQENFGTLYSEQSHEKEAESQGIDLEVNPSKEIKIPIKEKAFVKVIDMSTGFPENEHIERFMPKSMRKNG